MNTDAVLIAERGGYDARRVPIIAPQVSWELSNVGSFSAFARIADLRAVGLGGELQDRWLSWARADVGRWAGPITGRPLTDGVAELTAEDWSGQLRQRILDQWDTSPGGQPPGLARRALMSSVGDVPAFVTIGALDEGGIPLATTLGGENVLEDVLPRLNEEGGMEWQVDPDRVLTAGQRLGHDRSPLLRLTEGCEIVSYQLAEDAFAATGTQRLEIESAFAERRRNPGAVVSDSTTHWTEPRIIVTPTVAGRTPETVPLQLTLANRRDVWLRIELGDEVRVVIESAALSGTFRVMVRAFDGGSNTRTLSGEVTPDA
jgi:hypothetical protein